MTGRRRKHARPLVRGGGPRAWQRALAQFYGLEDRSLEPSEIYPAVLRARASTWDWRGSIRLLGELFDQSVKADLAMYTSATWAEGKAGSEKGVAP